MGRLDARSGNICQTSVNGHLHALVIEDDFVEAMALEDFLRELGFASVTVTATEEDAVAAAQDIPPDLIIADQQLKQGTGASAVERILDSHRNVPAIFVTGSSLHASKFAAGLVLQKPFCESALLRAVRELGLR